MLREFAIPANPDQIPHLRREVLRFLEEQGCPEEFCFDVGMALQEALANAILHGCKSNEAHSVTVEVQTSGEDATVVVRDPGPGFDRAAARDPASPDALTATSGRGLLMMRAYMDEVTFARNGSEIRLRKRWKAAQRA